MDWSAIFDEAYPASGATEAEIQQFVATIGQPLSPAEITEVNRMQGNPFPQDDPLSGAYQPFDPTRWVMPVGPLPFDYLSLLRWSNGGEFRTGKRWFQFFSALDSEAGVRAMLLAYHVPEYMAGALPFALNGGGILYLFDCRAASAGDYPVGCAACGNLGWEDDQYVQIAPSFREACRGMYNVEEIM